MAQIVSEFDSMQILYPFSGAFIQGLANASLGRSGVLIENLFDKIYKVGRFDGFGKVALCA